MRSALRYVTGLVAALAICSSAYAGHRGIFFYGDEFLKSLRKNLNLDDLVYIRSGTADPRVTATDAPKGSIYLWANGASVFVKNDDGTTTNWTPLGAGGSSSSSGGGISNLNGQTGATQTFSTATTGTDFAITSAANNHEFAIPDSSATARGLLTSAFFSDFNSRLSALNSLTPDANHRVAIAAGSNITLLPSGSTLTISAQGDGQGITSIDSMTAAAQTFLAGSAGTDFNIVHSGASTHTYNLPTADATHTGKLSSTDWTTFNNKLSTLNSLVPDANHRVSVLPGTGITIAYGGSTMQISTTAVSGSGTDKHVTRWNGTTAIQDSGAILSDDQQLSGIYKLSGGSSVIGNLIFNSTTNPSKGKLYFGENQSSAYNEAQKTLSIGIDNANARLQASNFGNSDLIGLRIIGNSLQTRDLISLESATAGVVAHASPEGYFAAAPGAVNNVSFQFQNDANTGLNWTSPDSFDAMAKAIRMQNWDATNGRITINPSFQGFDTYIHTANDPTGTFFVSGGGDHVDLGLGETPVTVGAPSKLNIQVGGIRTNFGAITATHVPTASTTSIVPPTERLDFLFEQAAAAAKTMTRSMVEWTYSPTTSNAGATLTLGTTSNKAMHMTTFSPTQTAGTLTYPNFRAYQYQRNLDGAGIVEEYDINQVGIQRSRYAGVAAVALGVGVPDSIVVAFGANQASPDAQYAALLTGNRVAYTVKDIGNANVGTGWLYVKAVVDDSTKATTGFTGYVEYQAVDAITMKEWGAWVNILSANTDIIGHYAGGRTVTYDDTDYLKVEWWVHRYY